MGNDNVSTTKPEFEDVDIQTFIGSNTPDNASLRAIIVKIAGNNPTMVSGLESLWTEEVLLRSFQRGLLTLVTAKNERALQTVEAAFQTTINEVKTYNAQNSPYMDDKKTSLYLYTLQNLVMNLDRWKLPHNALNRFKPALKEKLQYAKLKSISFGIGDDIIRRECYSTAYQQPYDPALRNFEFLDEARLNSYINHLRRYEVTQNPRDLYNFKTLTPPKITTKRTQAVETLIKHMEKKFQIKKMDLNYYKKNFYAINQELIEILDSNDIPKVSEVIDSIAQYLEAEQQFQNQVGLTTNNDDKTM